MNINKVAGADNVPDRVLKTCAEQWADFITGNSGKEVKQMVYKLETSQTSMVRHGPGQEGSTVGDWNHQNITGTMYRVSMASVKWDGCTEP